MTTARDILNAAAGHMQDRAATYDKPEGERSMGATVEAFKAVTGHQLTEEQGWLFMVLLKAVRSQQGGLRMDSYEDGAAYFALAGESAARDRKKPIIHELYTAHPATPNMWEAGERRMEQIGLNGNDGLAYEPAWIPTNGKEPDLPDGTLVDIKFLDGDVVIGSSTYFLVWVQVGKSYDITHYRIHQPDGEHYRGGKPLEV